METFFDFLYLSIVVILVCNENTAQKMIPAVIKNIM